MRSLICLSALILFFSSPAFALTWKVKVVFPDGDEKTYIPSQESFAVPMGKSRYKCTLSALETSGNQVKRSLDCRRGEDRMFTSGTCSKAQSGGSSVSTMNLRLSDEGKETTIATVCE